MSEEQSLKQKPAKGLFWGGLSSSVQQLLGLLFGVVLEDYWTLPITV